MDSPSSNLVVVSCPNHHEKLVSGLWNFYLGNHAVDFQFEWNSRLIRTHRLLLDLFLSQDKLLEAAASQQSVRQLRNCGLDSLLEFMYNGTVTVPESQLSNLMEVAMKLDFKMLVDALESAGNNKYSDSFQKPAADLDYPNSVLSCCYVTLGKGEIASPKSSTHGDESNIKSDPEEDNDSPDDGSNGKDTSSDDDDETNEECDAESTYNRSAIRDASDDKNGNESDEDSCASDNEVADTNLYELVTRNSHKSVLPDNKSKKKTNSSSTPQHKPIATNNRSVSNNNNSSTQLRRATKRMYGCKHCNCIAHTGEQMLAHLHSSHNIGQSIPAVVVNKSQTPDSSTAKTPCQQFAKVAKKSARKPVQSCDQCPYTSSNSFRFKIHMAKHDPNRITHYQCPHCPYTNKYRHQLGYHIKGMHSAVKPYRCEEPGCNYAASLKASLCRHVKVNHLGKKHYVCEKCAYRTYNQSRLTKHQRVHSDERLYKCSECERTFRDPTSLKQHMWHHTGEDERPHVCHICGTAFRRRDTLKTHLRCVHKTLFAPATTSSSDFLYM